MMMLLIAFRNILRHRRRSFLTGLTLATGYVLLSIAFAITEGSYNGLINRFTLDHTGHIQIHRQGFLDRPTISSTMADPEAVAKVLAADPDILAYAPRLRGPALAYAQNKTAPVQVLGVDPHIEPTVTKIREKLKAGTYLTSAPDADGFFGVMIGAGVAKNLKLNLGDDVVLISQGADGSVANDRYRVAGVIGTEDSADRLSVYLPLPAAREFFAMPGQVHEFVLRLEGFRQAAAVAERLNRALADRAVEAHTWQKIEEDFYRAMRHPRADLRRAGGPWPALSPRGYPRTTGGGQRPPSLSEPGSLCPALVFARG